MPNSRRYLYLYKGDNEFLADDSPQQDDGLLKDWNDGWAKINKEANGMQVEITEDMYLNSEYGETPEWIDVHIQDDMILQFKMARGVIKSLDGAHSIVFFAGIDCYTSDDFHIGHEEIAVTEGGAYVTLRAKHSSDEIELNITEQFNQAIGETA